MRIVAGRFKGRRVRAPRGDSTRPTTDRVREAVFSAIEAQVDLTGARVLDAFAGSGALGLEALSRGAAHAVFVERDRAAASLIRQNAADLGATADCTVVVGDVFALAASRRLCDEPFSLILLDPPYRIGSPEVTGLLRDLGGCGCISDGALVVYEHGADAGPVALAGVRVLSSKRYGSIAVDIGEWERGAHQS